MHFERTYTMDDDEARARLTALTDYWSTKHGVGSTWTDATVSISGKVKGVKFEGTVRVGDGRISADVKAGFLAEKLGGQAYVERKIADYLDPKNSLEALRARIPR